MTIRKCRGVDVTYLHSNMGNSPTYHPVYRVRDLENRKIVGDYYCDWDAAEEAAEYARLHLGNDLNLIDVRQVY